MHGGYLHDGQGVVALDPSFVISADWGFFRLKEAKLLGRISQSASLEASLDAAASCGVERFPLLARPVRFRPVTIVLGGVPLVFTPELPLYFDASAESEGHIVTSISQNVTASTGLKFKRGEGVTPIAEIQKSFSYVPPTLSAAGSVDASVSPEFSFLLYGVTGPFVGIHGGLRLAAASHTDPWWTLRAYLSGYGGIAFRPLGFEKSLDPIFTKTWLLAQAEDGPPGPRDNDDDGWADDVDCNDSDASINPDANDVPGDGIDQDCDGVDLVLGTGDVQATLSWDHEADMDLHLFDPDGEEIYYGNDTSASGGTLDHDANVGCGLPDAVENIFWPTVQPRAPTRCGSTSTTRAVWKAPLGTWSYVSTVRSSSTPAAAVRPS